MKCRISCLVAVKGALPWPHLGVGFPFSKPIIHIKHGPRFMGVRITKILIIELHSFFVEKEEYWRLLTCMSDQFPIVCPSNILCSTSTDRFDIWQTKVFWPKVQTLKCHYCFLKCLAWPKFQPSVSLSRYRWITIPPTMVMRAWSIQLSSIFFSILKYSSVFFGIDYHFSVSHYNWGSCVLDQWLQPDIPRKLVSTDHQAAFQQSFEPEY